MKTKQTIQFLFVSVWLIVATGCVTTSTRRAERLVSPLPKLTAAVEALVRYPDPAYPVPDDHLVSEAIKEKPELQRAFAGYPIKVSHDARGFHVSGQALYWQLINTKLVSKTSTIDLDRLCRSDDTSSSGRPNLYNADFVRRLNDVLKRGLISARKAANLLECNLDDVKEILMAYGYESPFAL